jgi:phage terminase large subunit-like protein
MNLAEMNPQVALAMAMEARAKMAERTRLFAYYPPTGPLRRELYPKHMKFFALGRTCPIRCFMAANRVGKTEGGGGYETTLHMTGRYPDWWEGSWFSGPIRCWVAGDTGKSVRDIVQEKLLGPYGSFGTGLIPAEDIVKWTPKSGVPQAVDTLTVKHYDQDGNYDGDSVLVFKSYDQGRKAFQGTEQDLIWLDEESDTSIRSECILRLMTTDGMLMETFTPLSGLTELVQEYLPKAEDGEGIDDSVLDPEAADAGIYVTEGKAMVMAGWDDVPHLKAEQKKLMLANTPPYLRDARSKGIPSLGAGAIYPVPESEVVVDDFAVPQHWHRLYGMDVGWNRTAAAWGAWDRESDIIYLYSEHYRGQAEPSIHADAIKARGRIAGEIDPAARGRSQTDGEQLLQKYTDLGLKLALANNGVESGIYEVWQRLSTGRLKVFKSCRNIRNEYRVYRRDENGKIVKKNDHIMDAVRYLVNADEKHWKPIQGDKPKWVMGHASGPSDPGMGY